MNLQLFALLYNLTHRSQLFDWIVFVIAEYGDSIMIAITAVALIVFFIHDKDWKRRKWVDWLEEVITMGFATIIPWYVTYILKIVFHIPRPFVTFAQVQPLVIETPFTSYPSGHATVFFALATAMYMYHKKLGYFFFGCAFLIALSRVVSGVHYPIDILVGAVIGISFAYLSTIFLRKNK